MWVRFPPGTLSDWNALVCNTASYLRLIDFSNMKTSLRILSVLLTLAFAGSIHATDIVRIPPQYKKDALAAPDPEYPMKAQHLGYQGQGIYRLVINKKT